MKFSTEIRIPKNVTIEKKVSIFHFSGPLGSTQLNLQKIDRPGRAIFRLDPQNSRIFLATRWKSFFGSLSRIIENKIIGVSQGYLLSLRLVGVGYRVTREGDKLKIRVGLSHEIEYQLPKSIEFFSLQPSLFCLYGIDKNQITQVGAKIREKRPPSTYKGKGIRFLDQQVKLKEGKRK